MADLVADFELGDDESHSLLEDESEEDEEQIIILLLLLLPLPLPLLLPLLPFAVPPLTPSNMPGWAFFRLRSFFVSLFSSRC